MNCAYYKNTECMYENKKSEEVEYCCMDCLMHCAVEHDRLVDEGKIKY